MIERFEKFSLAIFEITRYWHKLANDEMLKIGLKGPHATYLTTLYKYDDGVTAPKLSELCSKDKADVSRMMSIMEEKGLVVKESGGKNTYRGLLKLTEKGRKVAKALQKRIAIAVEMAGKGLSDKDRENFYSSLELISTNLRTLSEDGLPQ
ncbi:MAG: winged helix-turn-helix transcriptional regulator [Ruminococcaceae bacterium]|nr:winged helix-turn-helix transcriptional regulator [Oscillospiraceae bacterium]